MAAVLRNMKHTLVFFRNDAMFTQLHYRGYTSFLGKSQEYGNHLQHVQKGISQLGCLNALIYHQFGYD